MFNVLLPFHVHWSCCTPFNPTAVTNCKTAKMNYLHRLISCFTRIKEYQLLEEMFGDQ